MTFKLSGFKAAKKSLPPASGCGSLNNLSYIRTSALKPSFTATHVMAALAFTVALPGVPLLVSGITVASISVMFPEASFTQPLHSMTYPPLSRTLLPGNSLL